MLRLKSYEKAILRRVLNGAALTLNESIEGETIILMQVDGLPVTVNMRLVKRLYRQGCFVRRRCGRLQVSKFGRWCLDHRGREDSISDWPVTGRFVRQRSA